MVEQVLSNEAMDRLEKIDRLEAILAAATQGSGSSSPAPPSSGTRPTSSCCCRCHHDSLQTHNSTHASPPASLLTSQQMAPSSPFTTTTTSVSTPVNASIASISPRTDAQCQTLSTGDIVITKVFFPDSPDNAKDNKK